MDILKIVLSEYGKSIGECTKEELYHSLLKETNRLAQMRCGKNNGKKLYYISAEFLIGKLLSNNLINLGIYDTVKQQLASNGVLLSDLEEIENEPSLGNGGLGRLAACFLDSIATLSLNGDGVGLNYHFGLFRQILKNNIQTTVPDQWISKDNWMIKTDKKYTVAFKDFTVNAVMYDINVIGYNGVTNKLHLFDIEGIDESIVEDGIHFDKENIKKNLTLFLYPDDSDEAGRLLRIYQQYFMVAGAAQLILEEAVTKGSNLYDLDKYTVIQINDTHPSMIIPELIRILTERGMDMDDAIMVVSKCCAYTNHTILAEALEKWPIAYLKKVVPQLVPIIEVLDDKVRRKYTDPSVYIIDAQERVHMAHLDIHCCFSVNGVAALHTDILKENELNNFYQLYTEKFNNKTNGITFRRWLYHSNPELTEILKEYLGNTFQEKAENLKNLRKYEKDSTVLNQILEMKKKKKAELADYLKKIQGYEVNENSIFDIQIKRLHEYKRQQLNLLYVIHKYLEIKKGKKPTTPITVIFGAKAAPAYTIAQDIIHLILCLQELINQDSKVNQYLNIFMVENYNVTSAEKIFPAADISEQISLASKEASGTGNMKFMLNGAITIGTEDGANVEIHELVGDDNIYIFGDSSETVVKRYAKGNYCAKDYYEKNKTLKEAVDFITGKELLAVGDKVRLTRLSNELINKDWFMTFPDFDSYVKTKEKVYADYEDRQSWAKKMLVNIAMAGYFSSDRTIAEYNKDIWKL